MHGIFDEQQTAKALLKALCDKKGIESEQLLQNTVNWQQYKQKQYDILAETIRNSLDMKAFYNILNGDE